MPRGRRQRTRPSGKSPPARARRTKSTGSSPAVRPGTVRMPQVRLTVLGSGDAFGAGGRLHSGYLVEAPGVTFLVDCGPSVLQAMKRGGHDPAAIDFILLSHFHGDHFGGIPFLFMEYRYEEPRTRPLRIYGPPGTRDRVGRLFTALYERTATEPLGFAVDYTELGVKEACEVGAVRILPILVPHSAELVCYGYRIDVAGRSLLYSGDTTWSNALGDLAAGVDLFLCECSTWETKLDIHIAYPEIAARAAGLGCRRLVLTHLGSEVLARLDEVTLECATDGMTIVL
jgi:ribonuclease BN (tRNA processing enzyme)